MLYPLAKLPSTRDRILQNRRFIACAVLLTLAIKAAIPSQKGRQELGITSVLSFFRYYTERERRSSLKLIEGSKWADSSIKERRGMRQMRGSISSKHAVAVFVALAFLLFASKRACAQSSDNDGCTNATLRGDYAFTISGQVFLPNGTAIQRGGIAMTHFDGGGNLTQVDFVISSPNAGPPPGSAPVDPISGFHTEEAGTYAVYSDCTGTFKLTFPNLTATTGGSISGAVIVVKFVLSEGGRSIHAVVSSLTPPGAPGPVPALIHSEGHKLQPVRGILTPTKLMGISSSPSEPFGSVLCAAARRMKV
jgi:hypothetical protein